MDNVSEALSTVAAGILAKRNYHSGKEIERIMVKHFTNLAKVKKIKIYP